MWTEENILAAADQIIAGATQMLKAATPAVRQSVPVSPGVPNTARTIIQSWSSAKGDGLVTLIVNTYRVSPYTARLWIHTVRNAGQ